MIVRRAGNQTQSSQAANDALRRFPGVSMRKLASYLVARHPGLFADPESARSVLRNRAGLNSCNGTVATIGLPPGAGRVAMPPTERLERVPYALPHGVWGILSDIHVPYHEPRPIEAAMGWFRDAKVTGIILNGDAQDCEALSYWAATRTRNFVREVEVMADFLDYLRSAFPRTKIVWRLGNHEERLDRYYRANAPQLADLPTADMATILCLEERGITLLDAKQKITADELTILHGHEMKGSYSVVSPSRWALLKAKSCVAVAHFHQTSETAENDLTGRTIGAWSFGCLCDLSPDYNPYGNRWNWGAALLHHEGRGAWNLENRKILNNGKLV